MPFVQYAQDRQTVCYMSKNSAGITFFDKSVKYFTAPLLCLGGGQLVGIITELIDRKHKTVAASAVMAHHRQPVSQRRW